MTGQEVYDIMRWFTGGLTMTTAGPSAGS